MADMRYKEVNFLEPVPAIVVALDIGRSTSGFSYSIKDSNEAVTGITNTAGENYKVPSVILLDTNLKFSSFGNAAVSAYDNLSEKDCRNYHCFESLILPNTGQVTEQSVLTDKLGQHVNALTVYELVIAHLKKIALSTVKGDGVDAAVDSVLWMITLPEPCHESLRHFLHEAATRANIPNDRIRLVSGVEAVTVLWQENLKPCNNVRKLSCGENVLVIDMKENVELNLRRTVDCRNRQKIQYENVTISDAGGKQMGDEVDEFFRDLVGSAVWETFKDQHCSDHRDLLNQVETQLRQLSLTTTSFYFIKVSRSLLTIINTFDSASSFLMVVDASPYRHLLLFDETLDRLYLGKRLLEAFYLPTVQLVQKTVYELVNELDEEPVKYVVIHGDLAESPYVKEELSARLGRFHVTFLPASAVTKGAVIMGQHQHGVEHRTARFSYGILAAMPFVEGEHPDYLRRTCDGENWCESVFIPIIERGQVVTIGDTFTVNMYSTALDKRLKYCPMDTLIMMSKLKKPKFCTKTDGCSLLGKISLDPPAKGWPKICKGEIKLIVQQHNFLVEIVNKTTGQIQGSYMNFIN